MFGQTSVDGRSTNLAVQQTAVFNGTYVNTLRFNTITGPTGTSFDVGAAYLSSTSYFSGPWPTISPPSAMSGSSFFISSPGLYRMTFNGTARGPEVPAVPEILGLRVWLDGILVIGATLHAQVNQPNQIATLVPSYIYQELTHGIHDVYYQAIGNTNSTIDDIGTFTMVNSVVVQ